MRVLFLVQGEGRGHLTQALSLAQMLQSAGHEVTGAVVGTTAERSVPAFFSDAFSAPIKPVFSPGLVYDADTNELEPVRTALQAIRHAGPLWRSLTQVRAIIVQQKPCVVVNFYELLGGLTYALWRPSVPMICIAHQYMAFHPNFQHPNGHWFAKQGFKINTRLTCLGAAGLQLMVIYVPFFNDLFQTQPLTWAKLGITVAVSSIVFWAVEIQKLVSRRMG